MATGLISSDRALVQQQISQKQTGLHSSSPFTVVLSGRVFVPTKKVKVAKCCCIAWEEFAYPAWEYGASVFVYLCMMGLCAAAAADGGEPQGLLHRSDLWRKTERK